MTCSNCNSIVSKTRTFYTPQGKFENCSLCPSKFESTPLYRTDANIKIMRVVNGKKIPQRSPAYDNDISRRVLNPDNSISRNYGRSVFSMR